MEKKVLKEVIKRGSQHLANLLESNAKNIDKAFEDLMLKTGGSGKATSKVSLHLNLQKNLEGAGGVKVSAGISGSTTFRDSTAPETVDTHEKLPGMDK